MDRIIQKDAMAVLENLGAKNDRFSGKSLLLTGAAGFLGAHFMHYFAVLNHTWILDAPVTVLAVDNFVRGKPGWVTKFGDDNHIRFVAADVTMYEPGQQFDFIIHAASIASPTYYRKHPIETMDANILGLRQLLDSAVSNSVESMLFFSSSEIYGDPTPENIPTSETYNGNVSCTGPRACYDESKRFGETLCVNYQRVYGIPVKIVRPFNNYGPGLDIHDARVVPDFFRDVLADRDIRLLSDGSPTRTFCYISDAITGYLLALLSGEDGESFNIGVDRPEISIHDLARLIIQLSGKPLQVIRAKSDDSDYLEDNPEHRCPDISKARRLLGYEPKIKLEEGLDATRKWYVQNATVLS